MKHFFKEINLIIKTFKNRPLYFLDDLLFRLGFFSHNYTFQYLPRKGGSYKCRIGTSDHVEGYIIFSGKEYDLSIFQSKKYLSILDIGGNVGLFSLYCDQLLNISSIYIFEPSCEHRELLLDNIKHIDKNIEIKIFHKGIYDYTGKVLLTTNSKGSTDSNHIVDNSSDNTIEIDVMTLEDIGNQKFDILKMDIEGSEYKVLNKSIDRISKNIKYLFIEYHYVDEKFKLSYIDNLMKNNKFETRFIRDGNNEMGGVILYYNTNYEEDLR